MGNSSDKDKESNIYLSIDHLKKGKYKLRIIQKNRVIKLVTFKNK